MDNEDAFPTTNLVKASLPSQNNDSTENNEKDNREITTTTQQVEEENVSVPVNKCETQEDDTKEVPLEDENITKETSTLTTTTSVVENIESVPEPEIPLNQEKQDTSSSQNQQDLNNIETISSGSEVSTVENDCDTENNEQESSNTIIHNESTLVDENTLVESITNQSLDENNEMSIDDECDKVEKNNEIKAENINETEKSNECIEASDCPKLSPEEEEENKIETPVNVCQDAIPSTSTQDTGDICEPTKVEPETINEAASQEEPALNNSMEVDAPTALLNTSAPILTDDDSNLSNDSDQLVIDQDQLPAKSSNPTKDSESHTLNGFDFNNYLKRKICDTIEESIGGSTKKRRPSRARKKNNGDTLQPQPQSQPQPPPNNILEYLLENKHNKLLDSSGTTNLDIVKPKDIVSELFPVPSMDIMHPSSLFPMLSNVSQSMMTTITSSQHVISSNTVMHKLSESIVETSSTALVPVCTSSTSLSNQSRLKIYKCSSCNKLFENWNLFLHMRQIHKKHICLQMNCFRHFVSADKLLAHLESKHSLTKKYYNDQHDILNSYKNMYNSELYLMCVECEHVFNETDEFTHHLCLDFIEPCQVCGLRQKCDHSNKGMAVSNAKGLNRNRKRPPPKKNNNNVLNKTTELVPPLIIAKTPDRKSLHTIPSTPASGGELKMKFKFSRLDNSKDSPCKITVESPLLQSGDVRLNGANTPNTTCNKNEFDIQSINPPMLSSNLPLTPQMNNFDAASCRSNLFESTFNSPEDFSYKKQELFPMVPTPHFNSNAGHSFDQIQDKENASLNQELPIQITHSAPIEPQFGVQETEETKPMLVPKLKLQIPKNIGPIESEESSTESDLDDTLPKEDGTPVKDAPEVETAQVERCVTPTNLTEEPMDIEPPIQPYDSIEVANEYTQLHDLQMIEPLDKIDLAYLLRKCLEKTIPYCLYCYHARRIAVCGRGLALHLIGNHRFQATVDSITAEELKPQTFVAKFKSSLDDLENVYLNLDTYNSLTNTVAPVIYPKETFYECMQCRFTTGTHKELYVHNRKLHLKSKLICIMCKIPFYSFSDLISHMCPGVSNKHTILDFEFRCCLCNMDRFPSAFRLMIHLRKRHFACDVCLEECYDTVKLSSHVWKHKLHHLCYRCGIAYRNKADIQKHLFWRHGTESVQCKKCLQKKWPHVYHFCTPPAIFYCEVCSMEFTRAVALRVHKRIHNDVFPYPCTEEGCEKKFISKKLLLHHLDRHNGLIEPPVEEHEPEQDATKVDEPVPEEKIEPVVEPEPVKRKSNKRRKREDILALISGIEGPNLSESDSSDESDNDTTPSPMNVEATEDQTGSNLNENETKEDNQAEENLETTQNVDIWEKFKSFQEAQGHPMEIQEDAPAEKEPEVKEDHPQETSPVQMPVEIKADPPELPKPAPKPEKSDEELYRTMKIELYTCQSDHDYCIMYPPKINLFVDDFENEIGASVIRDNARLLREAEERQAALQAEQRAKFFRAGSSPRSSPPRNSPPRKRRVSSSSSSSSSSDSSSSCSCGSSCSCSSSSSSSSSDSDSDDENRQSNKSKRQQKQEEQEQIVPVEPPKPIDPDSIMLECDLETDESETDEEFYDEHPQKLANQQLADKRRQLMLQTCMDPENADGIIENSRPSTPSLPDEIVKEKKIKLKKKKRDKKQKQDTPVKAANIPVAPVDPLKLYESFTQSYVQEFQAAPSAIAAPVQEQPLLQHPNEPLAVQPYHPTSVQLYQPPVSLIQDSPMPSALQIQAQRQQPGVYNTPTTTPFGVHTPLSEAGRTKRKRVPNKFYGYDDVDTLVEKNAANDPYQPPPLTWDKDDLPATPKPQRPTSKRPSSAKNPTSRTNSRVNSLERSEEQPILPPVIIKTSQITSTPTRIEPLKITIKPNNEMGNIFMGESDDSGDNLRIVQPKEQQKIPKIKLGTLKKSRSRPAASNAKANKSRQRKSTTTTTTTNNALPERTGPRIINAPPTTTIQLEQYPSSFNQPLYPTPPATATAQQQPPFPQSSLISNPYYREGYPIQKPANWRPANEGEKVYCYCRCPYDEVSEMIGCDDDNCRVEWFHFECVGILMAPTGKWYCPDCKPRHMHEFATDYPDSSGSY